MIGGALRDIGILALITILLLAGLVAGVDFVLRWECAGSAEQNEVNHRYSTMGGCSYQEPATGMWVPRDNYRAYERNP